ncbi:MAG: DUF2797 domain-containing protein [Flavobacteriales bacterium]
MKYTGNIRKMKGVNNEQVNYFLRLYDVLEPAHEIALNQLIGQQIKLTFENEIHCVVTGKKIKKPYGEGMSYDAFISSPLAVESILRPELSRIHEGIALRDEAWELEHHLKPHFVYLSLTSGLKVGVTRTTQVPTRWIDQGATEAIVLAETPYRQAAGLIEVSLKQYLADKTNWQAMLKGDVSGIINLIAEKQRVLSLLPEELVAFAHKDDTVTRLNYPVLVYPQKITNLKFEKTPVIQGKLAGIKGQYLLFADGSVLNVRSHTAYKISLEF